MIVLTLGLSVFLGFAAAFVITEISIKKSNDLGDSKAEFEDFTDASLVILESKNNVRKKDF